MNTNKVYFAIASVTTKIEYEGDLEDYYFWQGIRQNVLSDRIMPVLVIAKENIFDKFILKDLNVKIRYTCKLPTTVGKVFIRPQTLRTFNEITGNATEKLPKRKIKKIGNKQFKKYLRNLEEE